MGQTLTLTEIDLSIAARLWVATGILILAAPGRAAGAGEASGLWSQPDEPVRQAVLPASAWPAPAPELAGAADRADDETSPGAARVESLFSLDYVRLLWADTRHVATAPVRWDLTDWGIAAGASAVLVGTALFVDKELDEAIQRNRNATTDNLARDFDRFGTEYSLIILAGFELGGLIFDDDRSRAVAHDGLAASLIAGAISNGLKHAVGRARPSQGKGEHHFSPFSEDVSFPSAHATQAFAVATVVAEHYDSLAVDIGAYGLAAMVGYSRMDTGSHYASDVLAGALIGVVVGRTVTAFNRGQRWSVGPFVDEYGLGMSLRVRF